MPKLKTHKGLSKVTKVRPGGTVKINKAGKRHNTGGKPASFNRNKRKATLMSTSDMNRVKKIIK